MWKLFTVSYGKYNQTGANNFQHLILIFWICWLTPALLLLLGLFPVQAKRTNSFSIITTFSSWIDFKSISCFRLSMQVIWYLPHLPYSVRWISFGIYSSGCCIQCPVGLDILSSLILGGFHTSIHLSSVDTPSPQEPYFVFLCSNHQNSFFECLYFTVI